MVDLKSLRRKNSSPEFSRVYLRTSLFEQFDKARQHGMLWIAAPPGAGKTVAVSSYLKANELPVLWYSVDARDEDPAHFFLSLVRSAQAFDLEEASPLPLLTPEYRPYLDVFSRNFFDALFRHLPQSTALVLDNYQKVRQTVLHEILRNAAEQVRTDTTLIVISREEPPATFARLRVHGSMTCISWNDLKLSLSEAQCLADLRAGESVPPEFVAQYYQRSQGWAAGLVLLLDQARTITDKNHAPGDPGTQLLFDYFAEEIFSRLPVSAQNLLLQIVLLPHITPLFAEKLTGSTEVSYILDSLHKNSFFVARRPGSDSAYEFHPLFHEFLASRAERTLSRDDLRQLRKRVAEILVDAGRTEDAVPFYIAQGDWPTLTKTLLKLAPEMLMQGRHQTLLAWLEAVPEVVMNQDAWMLYYFGNALSASNPAAARCFYEQSYGLFDAQDDSAGLYLAWSSILDSYFLEWSDFSGIHPWAKAYADIRARHPVFPSPEIEVRVHTMLMALTHANPRHPDLPGWAESARKLVESESSGIHNVFLACMLMNFYHWVGDFTGSATVMNLVRNRFGGSINEPIAANLFDAFSGLFHWFRGNGEDCLRAIRAGLDRANASGIHVFDSFLAAGGVYGNLLLGDLPRAEEFLNSIRAMLRSDCHLDFAHFHFMAGFVRAQHRDWPQAVELFSLSRDFARQASALFPETVSQIALTRALFQMGREREARVELATALEVAKETRSVTLECMGLLTEAEAYLANGERTKGLVSLEQGLTLSRLSGGLVATANWGPEANARLYAIALEAEIEIPFVQGLIRRMGLTPPDPTNAQDNWPWRFKIYTLGQFLVIRDGETFRFNGKVQHKPLELLMAIIAHGGTEVAQARIIDALWPDAEGNAGYRALITTLQRLRKLLDYPDAVLFSDGRLSLDPRYVWVDTWAFERMLDGRAGTETATTAGQVFMLYRGRFLDHVEAPWAIASRERLRARHRSYVLSLGLALENGGLRQDAIDLFQKCIAIDASVDAFHQHLIRCHIKQDQIAEARASYEHYHRVFASLGLSPSRETQSLIQPYL